MISLLFLSLVAAASEGASRLRGTFVAGPEPSSVVHQNSGLKIGLDDFGDRREFVCELLLNGAAESVVYGHARQTRVNVSAEFKLRGLEHEYHGWVSTLVEGRRRVLYPHALIPDVIDLPLRAPFDLTVLRELSFGGSIAPHLETLLKAAQALEGGRARGQRTFVALGKFDAEGRFDAEVASVMVRNLLTDLVPYLTIVRGFVEPAPLGGHRLSTPTGQILSLVEGPSLGNTIIPGHRHVVSRRDEHRDHTFMGLQIGSELRVIRRLD